LAVASFHNSSTHTRGWCSNFSKLSDCRVSQDQARSRGGRRVQTPCKIVRPPGKMFWAWFKTIGYGLKYLGSSQKTLRLTWCPKLVTGLIIVSNSFARVFKTFMVFQL